MKSPAQLSHKLKSQWFNAGTRELRLLGGSQHWPLKIGIGLPKPSVMTTDLDAVIAHINAWKEVTIGDVVWENVSYRAAAEPVSVPVTWQLNKPSEWVQACGDKSLDRMFNAMADLVSEADPAFHSLLIRRHSLWRDKPLQEVLLACQVAATLTPGYAQGKPLRALSIHGIDTKFFERHARLITTLLDTRFEGEASTLGLEVFLNALSEGDHWLLLIDLDGGLLPFTKQRVSSADLAQAELPGQQLLIVENESSQHQLPSTMPGTLAILGAGLDLDWTANPNLAQKRIGYWGDIDTWGLQCLARARASLPQLQPLLMNLKLFNQYSQFTVTEPVVASDETPDSLRADEQSLYRHLLSIDRGRLEQEFIPENIVKAALTSWSTSQTG